MSFSSLRHKFATLMNLLCFISLLIKYKIVTPDLLSNHHDALLLYFIYAANILCSRNHHPRLICTRPSGAISLSYHCEFSSQATVIFNHYWWGIPQTQHHRPWLFFVIFFFTSPHPWWSADPPPNTDLPLFYSITPSRSLVARYLSARLQERSIDTSFNLRSWRSGLMTMVEPSKRVNKTIEGQQFQSW